MNSDATQPTLKLGIAFAGMSLLGVDYALSELSRGSGWWMLFIVFVYLPVYAWIAWVGVFKAPSLQLMWGWGALLLGGCRHGCADGATALRIKLCFTCFLDPAFKVHPVDADDRLALGLRPRREAFQSGLAEAE